VIGVPHALGGLPGEGHLLRIGERTGSLEYQLPVRKIIRHDLFPSKIR
jgi:hypothetical protein